MTEQAGKWVRDGTIMAPGNAEIDIRCDDEGRTWITIKGDNNEDVESIAALVESAPDLQQQLDEALEALRDLREQIGLIEPDPGAMDRADAILAKHTD